MNLKLIIVGKLNKRLTLLVSFFWKDFNRCQAVTFKNSLKARYSLDDYQVWRLQFLKLGLDFNFK